MKTARLVEKELLRAKETVPQCCDLHYATARGRIEALEWVLGQPSSDVLLRLPLVR